MNVLDHQEPAAGLVRGVVGLGAMGMPMARAISGSPGRTVVFDVNPGARERAATAGLDVADTLEDLVRQVDVVILSLPVPSVVEAVVGDIVRLLTQPLTVLDTSTIDPDTARRCSDALAARNGEYVDCPILGRPASAGGWTLPVGGSRAGFELARQAMAPVARSVVHVGEVGAGHTMKLLNNLMLGTINAATAEVLLLARAAGVDPGLFVDMIVDSGAASVSGLFREIAPRAVDGDFEPTFSLRLMHKDNALALRLADSLGIPLGVAGATQVLNTMAVAAGHGNEDSVAVLRVLEELTGMTARRGQTSSAAEGQVRSGQTR